MRFYNLIFKTLALSCCLLVGHIAQAQKSDIGFLAGPSFYFGDLGKHWNHYEGDQALGFFYRKNFNSHWSWRTALQWGQYSGADSTANTEFKQNRNLSFRSKVLDVSTIVEFNFFNYSHLPKDKKATPYIFAGIGVAQINPKAFYNRDWVALQPLNTEGQGSAAYPSRKPYKLVQITMPLGIGYKVMLGKYASFGLEASFRKTFTDYLDDVSTTYVDDALLENQTAQDLADRSINGESRPGFQRGNPYKNDWYAFMNATLVIQFRRHSQSCADFGR